MTTAELIQQQDTARRALRGEGAYKAAGIPAPPGATPGPPALQHAPINVASIGTHNLVAGLAGQKIQVYEIFLWSAADQTLELWDGADTLTGPLSSWPAQSGMLLPNVGEPRFSCQANNSLRLSMTAAAQVSGYVLFRMV